MQSNKILINKKKNDLIQQPGIIGQNKYFKESTFYGILVLNSELNTGVYMFKRNFNGRFNKLQRLQIDDFIYQNMD